MYLLRPLLQRGAHREASGPNPAGLGFGVMVQVSGLGIRV